jgi:hypothetical protein
VESDKPTVPVPGRSPGRFGCGKRGLSRLNPDIGGEALLNKSSTTKWPCHYLIKVILGQIDTSK